MYVGGGDADAAGAVPAEGRGGAPQAAERRAARARQEPLHTQLVLHVPAVSSAAGVVF